MHHLTALLAFSAVMIVLATLATVIVEGIHKISRRRATDFEQMLAKLYDDAVVPRLTTAGLALAAEADEFVAQIKHNPAVSSRVSGLLAKVPIVRNLFDTAFEELTTRQFIEQFAQTAAGKQLQQVQDPAVVQATISALAYQFERYGDAASSYFQRRATTFSVLVAFVMALTLNVDAVKLYAMLATDDALSAQVVAELDIDQLEKVYQASLENADDDERKRIDQAYRQIHERILADATRLEGFGLPIGHTFFPYCSELTREAAYAKDPRCQGLEPFRPEATCGALCSWAGNAWTVVGRVFSQNGIGWLVSALLAGGMIGLGAPFWFKAYRYVASFVPGMKPADQTQARRNRYRGPVGSSATATRNHRRQGDRQRRGFGFARACDAARGRTDRPGSAGRLRQVAPLKSPPTVLFLFSAC